MRLHKNKDDFTEAIQAVSRGLNISPALIEKDYYVTLVLKRINEEISGLIFKGGTSLSKCHKAINRFSEDIDLTLDSEHLTEGQRKIVKPTIVKICEELGLTINNLENTRSRRDYNCYQISYPLLLRADSFRYSRPNNGKDACRQSVCVVRLYAFRRYEKAFPSYL